MKREQLLENNKGVGILLPVALMFVFVLFGMSLTMLITFESKGNVKSEKSTAALYLADAGVERAIFSLNASPGPYTFSGSESYLPDGTDPQGTFVVTISSSPAIPNTWTVTSTGYVPNSLTPQFTRKVEAVCVTSGGSGGSINVTSALLSNGNVSIEDWARITGATLTGVKYNGNYSKDWFATVTGTPVKASSSFPSFNSIFGMSMTDMQDKATNFYNTNMTNPATSHITFVNGNATCGVGWSGSGILIVNGNLKMTGGTFTGVIYANGNLNVSGGTNITGGVINNGNGKLSDTARIVYTTAAETSAESELGTASYSITSWQETL
jgi:hypothetical protein